MNHAATRYLEAKRTVDDRARSPRVRDRLLSVLPDSPRILDVGCGTGTTVPRLLEWGVDDGVYRGVDSDAGVVSFARAVRPTALRRAGYDVTITDDGFAVENLSVAFEQADAMAALDGGRFDLVVAQAFADLVPVGALLDGIESALAPGGLAYLPITFDGGTIFQPDHPADRAIERAYHEAIDTREGRDVHAGRHLADACRRRSGDLLGMASSDWTVRPVDDAYPGDEAYFLGRILDFVESALRDRPIEGKADWLATRREQLDRAELTYVAHQYDLLYRVPDT